MAACCAPTALYYTRVSQGEKAGGLTEAKFASILGTQAPATPLKTRYLADINNLKDLPTAALQELSRAIYGGSEITETDAEEIMKS